MKDPAKKEYNCRERTPGLNKKKRGRLSKFQGSDRSSDYDSSGSEAGSPHRNRRRHRSNRVKVVQGDQRKSPMEGVRSSNSDFPSLWEPSQNKHRLFINRVKVVKQEIVEDE